VGIPGGLGVRSSAAAVGASHRLRYALIHPIVVPAVMFLIAVFVMPETREHSIWEEGAIEAIRDAPRLIASPG
jgi:hypothetical protein